MRALLRVVTGHVTKMAVASFDSPSPKTPYTQTSCMHEMH